MMIKIVGLLALTSACASISAGPVEVNGGSCCGAAPLGMAGYSNGTRDVTARVPVDDVCQMQALFPSACVSHYKRTTAMISNTADNGKRIGTKTCHGK